MIINVYFKDSGIEKEFEFDALPMVDDVLTIQDGGVARQFWVLTVSGGIDADGKTRPNAMTVKNIDD